MERKEARMSMMDFAGGLAGAPPGQPPAIDVPPPGGEEGGGEENENSLDALDGAEEALHSFIRLDPDEVDRAEAGKALQIILKLKAANQTDTQQGGMKSLQRALGGGGPVGGGPVG